MAGYALVTITVPLTGSGNWVAPGNLVGGTVRCQVWGPTSGSGGATSTAASTGGGSGGAGYSEEPALAVTPGSSYPYNFPSGGAGGSGVINATGANPGDATFQGDSVTVTAHPGLPGACSNSNGALGSGAPASGNTIAFAGGNGSSGLSSSRGGAGGGSAGSQGPGGNAASNVPGAAGTPDGAIGVAGATAANTAGSPGNSPGGGAGGAKGGSIRTGGKGGDAKGLVTYQARVPLGGSAVAGRPELRKGSSRASAGAPVIPVGPPVPPPFYAPETAEKGRTQLHRGGHAQSKGAPVQPPPPVHVTPYRAPEKPVKGGRLLRRGGSRHQGGASVVPFPASVVNQWAGVVTQSPAWGSSLPGIASAAVDLIPANAVMPGSGTPTEGNWLFCIAGWNEAAGLPPATVSVGDDSHKWWRPQIPTTAGNGTRTTIWRQPNVIPPSCVYVAPSAYVDGLAVTVIEVGGLGPWDQLVAVALNSLTGTSLPLAIGAPSAPAFFIAAVTGNSAAADTALAPAGWTPLSTVTAVNGTDSTSDTVLASAYITSAAAQSIAGTASSGEALSGVLLAVLENGPSPVPPVRNQNWPSPVLFEAAFGSGYLTPPDEKVWTDLQAGFSPRFLSWQEGTGTQYELDALESTEATALLDNPDGALSPFNPASPYYPNVLPGTPIRIRMVPPGSDRWEVIERNIERFPQQWNEVLRGTANTAVTDIWSIINKELPTCYRAEVLNGQPYAWWPCDDPAVGNPTSLVNAAPGNALPLQIVTSPAGLGSTVSIPVGGGGSIPFKFSATEAFAQDAGYMYGDPNAAGWQQAGNGTGPTGRYLYCADPGFPSLAAAGVTVEAWCKYDFANTAPPNTGSPFGPPGQPSGGTTIWAMYSGGSAIVSLTLDSSGHLKLNGSSVYSGSDLRNTTWFGVTVVMTATTWQCWLNGGIIAFASGSLPGLAAWDAFSANATVSGGSISGCGNATFSHLAIYGVASPTPQVISRFTAAYTAFGQLPQPSGVSIQFIQTGQYAPDGNQHTGTFFQVPTVAGGNATLAALATGTAASETSGPQVPEAWNWCNSLSSGTNGFYAWLTGEGPAAPQYSWWTGSQAGSEGLAGSGPANYFMANGYGGGASPPTAPSPAGDTVQNRMERILQAGGVAAAARCIDPAPAAVVAELDTGGQAAGSNLAAIASSDSGLLFIDNMNIPCYFSRPRKAAQPVLWQLGADLQAGQIPYQFGEGDAGLDTDPQRVWNDIKVTQTDVTGGSGGGAASGSAETHGGLVFGPDASRYPAILASQQRYGVQPLQNGTSSYLQDQALIQSQANWYADEFAQPRQRIIQLMVKAEAAAVICPQAWEFWFANVGDVMQVFWTPPGQAAFSGLWRISKITSRVLRFGQNGTEASITVIGDVYTTEWS